MAQWAAFQTVQTMTAPIATKTTGKNHFSTRCWKVRTGFFAFNTGFFTDEGFFIGRNRLSAQVCARGDVPDGAQ